MEWETGHIAVSIACPHLVNNKKCNFFVTNIQKAKKSKKNLET